MDGIYQAWQTGLLWVCLCALGAMAALLFLAKVAAPAWDALRRWWSLPCIQRVIVAVCVVGLSYYGATKQGWHVGYDGGIKAGATANVVTNDTVSIHWQRDTSGGVYVPESAAVYIDYRPNTETNAEWGLLAQTTVGAWGWSGTVENATNYDYNVWAYYIPPEPVHTNGVWTYKTHFDRSGEYALPLRARVEVNGVAIATPAEKRKDAEKRPYDAEVEYLESTGTQYILLPAAYTRWDIRLKPKDIAKPSYSRFYAGCMNRGSRTASCYATSDSALEFQNYTRAVLTVPCYFYTWHDISVRSATVTVDGAVFTFSLGTAAYGSYIFGCDYNGVVGAKCQISYYRAYDENGNVVLDLIPVRFTNENNQSEGAMFDRANPTVGLNPDGSPRTDGLYRNRGTGNFGYGNDK